MKTIIIAGAVNKEMGSLTQGNSIGALHFVNKPLVAFTIENLQQTENKEIIFHSANAASDLNKKISPYIDWNTTLENEDNTQHHYLEETLWLRDDVLYDLNFYDLLKNVRENQNQCIAVFCNQIPVMFYKKNISEMLVKRNHENTVERGFPNFEAGENNHDYCNKIMRSFSWHPFELGSDQAVIIDTPKKFHTSAMKLLSNGYRYIELYSLHEDRRLIRGWHTAIDQSSQLQDSAYVGDYVNVNRTSQLRGHVILCQGSFIDEYVDIKNTIVMPDVYVGPYLDLSNAIVTGNEIIRIDNGVTIPIKDNKFTRQIAFLA